MQDDRIRKSIYAKGKQMFSPIPSRLPANNIRAGCSLLSCISYLIYSTLLRHAPASIFRGNEAFYACTMHKAANTFLTVDIL